MDPSGCRNASGYESTPVDRLAFKQSAKRLPISDAQLKVLPAFSYHGKQRVEFADDFRKLLQTWRFVWIVKNEPVISQVSEDIRRGIHVMGAPPTFFSPREQRDRVGPGVRGDDLKPDRRGMAYAPHASVKEAEGYIPRHIGPSGQYGTNAHFPPSGAYNFPPSGAYNFPPTGAYNFPPYQGAYRLPPPNTGAYRSSESA